MLRIKVAIVILIVFVIIIAFIMFAINRNSSDYDVDEQINDLESIIALEDKEMFFIATESINRYLLLLLIEPNEEMLLLLDDSYIRENNITAENVNDNIPHITTRMSFTAIEMRALTGKRIHTYAVHGIVTEANTSEFLGSAHFVVSIDVENETFAIKPVENIREIELQTMHDSIEKNERNVFRVRNISDEDIINAYLDVFRYTAMYKIEFASNLLDREYREVRFGNFAEFERYAAENSDRIRNINIVEYVVSETADGRQFAIIDQGGRIYIFRETAIMQFTILLDTHTLDLPEFIERYNSANDAQRMILNLDRFIQAINHGDYRFAYSRLAEGFRDNNFDTLQSFEEYVTNRLFANNEIRFIEFRNEGNILIYRVEIIDKNNVNVGPIQKTFIMQLQEGTDFVLSFNLI